jgi:hypothetical protein
MGRYTLGAHSGPREGKYKEKLCRRCKQGYRPYSPSQLYCSDVCADDGKTNAYLMRTYGISLEHYEKMYAEQGGLCAICNGEGFVMKECHSLKLVVDHCHLGGHVRGLLCHNCNRALGLLKDSTAVLSNAIDYLTLDKQAVV